jgi:hypothetical protein
MPRDRRIALMVVTLVGGGILALIATLPIALTPGVRARLTEALGERFDSRVEIVELHVSLLPRLRVQGSGLVLRHRGRTDVPPLIAIGSFTADANILGLLSRPLRLASVHLDRLEITLPPGALSLDDDDDAPSADVRFIIEDLMAERAALRVLRRDDQKPPRVWEIARLQMQQIGADTPWPFAATVTNPTPPGEITTSGQFGPWNAERPAHTPLAAEYEFRDADLGTFAGIRGILQSAGAFSGVLERIEVDGRADVPAFALDAVGNPVPLTAQFHAVVDATNGDTLLEQVRAILGETPLEARGGVVEKPGEDGKTVELDVIIADGRVEDVLRLAMKRPRPFITGGLALKARIVLPPGDGDALDTMRLDGTFSLSSARFTSSVQTKIDELSQKARGEAGEDRPPDRVASNFAGAFTMRRGVVRFSRLTFDVPGAAVALSGSYAIRSEAIDMRGTVRLQARLSEMTTGIKSILLKVIDPLVRRRNATEIPITIRGTAAKPDFGVDVKRMLTPG